MKETENFGDISSIETQVTGNRHNQLTATYYLIIKKYERGTDQDLVFGKFTRDKRVNEQNHFSRSSITSNQNQITSFGSQPNVVPSILKSKSGTGHKNSSKESVDQNTNNNSVSR